MNITYIILIISISFCVLIFFYFKWYIKRRTSASELLSEYRTEVYRLIAEIDAATDRDSMLVEDRIKKLKVILDDTDKRISVYTRELDRSRTGEALYTSLGRGIRAALKTPAEIPPPQPKLKSVPVPNESKTPAPPPAETQPSAPLKNSSKRLIRVQIETLVSEGLSPSEIASRLGISIAEVELAMNLMGRNNG